MHQKDYFDNLYRKTTASYRAKVEATHGGEQHIGRQHVANRQPNVDLENDSRRKGKSETNERRDRAPGILKERNDQANSHRNDPKTKPASEADAGRSHRRDPRQLTLIRKESTQGGSDGKGKEAATSSKPASESAASRPSRATVKTTNPMWIRPRSKNSHSSNGRRKVMDPVQLYQYYQNEWEKFKTNLPGETNRSELRWQIRYKLLGE